MTATTAKSRAHFSLTIRETSFQAASGRRRAIGLALSGAKIRNFSGRSRLPKFRRHLELRTGSVVRRSPMNVQRVPVRAQKCAPTTGRYERRSE
ncbi:MAG: hypothetical protein DWQ34_06135 [Planctomycetota bacterium]|nr:MAG: hypothetical protein DWQ34_06135 [Planctomycetota bacterium]REK26526.1 MAG: hypothetical protein DWQ41_09685 [Planctomycetota bacterium]REK33979.1 MAG: hypothetical protein DWQ45_14240 [Planctomycetota bacterium]